MSDTKYKTQRLAHWRTIDHKESFERTLADIEQYGWHAMLIKGETWNRFAYTVGIYDSLGIPELIVVGLTEKTAHIAMDLAIKAMQSGIDLTKGRHPNIVGEVGVEFHPVSREWYEHVMYRTNWYYGREAVPVLQIVYPDLDGHFQWDEGFNDYFLQPLLNSETPQSHREKDFWALNDPSSTLFNWKFDAPPHTSVYLSETVQKKEEPVTYVSHDTSDGAWQFLGDKMADGGGPVISCFHHPIDDDRSLEELHDLPLGWYAVRDKPGDAWQRFQKKPDEND
jgi:hypothetical protein